MLVGAATLLFVVFTVSFLPRLDTFKSSRTIAERMDALMPDGEVALFSGDRRGAAEFFNGAYNLYSRRLTFPVLRTAAEVNQFLAGGGHRLVLLPESASHVVPGTANVTPAGRVGKSVMLFALNFRVSGRG